jgi:hypothetical protein
MRPDHYMEKCIRPTNIYYDNIGGEIDLMNASSVAPLLSSFMALAASDYTLYLLAEAAPSLMAPKVCVHFAAAVVDRPSESLHLIACGTRP